MDFRAFCHKFLLPEDTSFAIRLYQSYQISPFFRRHLDHDAPSFSENDWNTPVSEASIDEAVCKAFESRDETLSAQRLRQARRAICAKLLFEQHHGLAAFETIALMLSTTAKLVIKRTLRFLQDALTKVRQLTQVPEAFVVIAMGKLGGNELNFSSDIDLVFLYHKDIEFKQKNGKTFSAFRFYTQLGQKMIAFLSDMTADGFVYRVDMRLRPFGEGSPLVSTYKHFDRYLINHAREWERYAYVKAAVITGAKADKIKLKRMIDCFVYRHYLDYKMLTAIRKMKQMINDEMKAENLKHNIKLGCGGIREIEFICQCFQLIYGGQNRHLQTASLKEALFMLADESHIAPDQAQALYRNYVLLRNIENALQMYDDEQTHSLPEDSERQASVAGLSGFKNWQDLLEALSGVRRKTQTLFDDLSNFSPQNRVTTPQKPAAQFSISTPQHNNARENSVEAEVHKFLNLHPLQVHEDMMVRHLISAVKDDGHGMLGKVLDLLSALYRRKPYLYLLYEKRSHFDRLLNVLNYGKRVRDMLAKYPFLLERVFADAPLAAKHFNLASFRSALNQSVRKIDLNDTEQYLESLRRFKIDQIFAIILAELQGDISLMESSDLFSYLATVIVESVLQGAWREIFKAGSNANRLSEDYVDAIGIIAYGKLGGFELSIDSDLDLVFLITDTNPRLKQRVFIRLVQKFIHFMQIATYNGKLYDIDVRLRPDGKHGLLVSTVTAYADYQRNKAWVWEHQALTRARFIAGSKQIKQAFNTTRRQVICRKYNLLKLKSQIVKMREKMRGQLLKTHDQFDLKQSRGGMIDIEFIAQFYALAYSHKVSEVAYFSDSIRIIQTIESARLISQKTADTLIASYCTYRQLGFECYLKREALIVPMAKVQPMCDKIIRLWEKIFV